MTHTYDRALLKRIVENSFNGDYENANKSEVARFYAKESNLIFTPSLRKQVNNILRKIEKSKNVSDPDLENETSTDTNQYRTNQSVSILSALKQDGTIMDIKEYCEHYKIPSNHVKTYKLVTNSGKGAYYNIASNIIELIPDSDLLIDLEQIVKKYAQPVNIPFIPVSNTRSDYFDRLVYTDTHIAMDVNGKDGDSMYEGKWDREELLRRLKIMVQHTIDFRKSNTLIIDDLGDFMDGLLSQTTRGGHALPQNMNDKEAFDLGLEFKISLVDWLVPYFDKIVCNNIINDNHSGVYSYFVSSAVKQILELKYPGRVKVETIKRFMGHYSIGKHTFIISHGKDSVELKNGFKPKLDPAQSEKIDQYCKEHGLYNGNFIEFSKGDSHQALYDDTTSNDFQYYNYPAFSPPSNWVTTNFKKSKSGFRLYNIDKNQNIKIAIPYWF